MMNAQAKPLAEVNHLALQELIDKVGLVDTIRFINQFSIGYGDYTKERDSLFAELTLDELLAAMAVERQTTRRPSQGAGIDRGQQAGRKKRTRRVPRRRG